MKVLIDANVLLPRLVSGELDVEHVEVQMATP